MAGVTFEDSSYHLLFKELYAKKFLWSVPNDDNRAFEGFSLREKFCDDEGFIYEPMPYECSIMELILGLAIRCHWILSDSPNNLTVSGWFWKLLGNIGLDKFGDEYFYEYGGVSKVDQILNRLIERTYDRYGNGGLFPLKKVKKDQRKVELWYQMCQFLVENYYIDDLAI